MVETLRLLAPRRVVLPGTVHTFPAEVVPDLGERVFVRFAGAAATAAGTVCDVEELRVRDDGGSIVTVFGSVRAVAVGGAGPRLEVRVEELGSASPSDVAAAVAAFRSYLGALAEYGEGADVMVDVPDDPVAAGYRLASLARISEPERQDLLDLASTKGRLSRIAAMFGRERALLAATMGTRGA